MTRAGSSNTSLTVDQLKEFRLQLLQAYETGSNQAEKQFERGNLSQTQFNDAVEELQKLKVQATKLLGLIMARQLDALLETNENSPATKIKAATDDLIQAAQKIQEFFDFLQAIADVIRITSGIIVALQTNTIAKIR